MSIVKGMLKAIILYVLATNIKLFPSLSHMSDPLEGLVNHLAALSESTSTSIFPSSCFCTDRTLPSTSPKLRVMLLISIFACCVSIHQMSKFLEPFNRNCFALIPSLAANLGLSCGGGFMSAFA